MRPIDVQRGPQTIPRYELLCFCCEASHTSRLLFSGASRNETAFSVSTTIRERSRIFAHGLGFLLVERVRDREDQRLVKVSLSEEGKEIMRSLQPVVEGFNEQLLPGPQRQAFIEDLQRFVARASTLVPESAGRFGFLREHLGYGRAGETPKEKGVNPPAPDLSHWLASAAVCERSGISSGQTRSSHWPDAGRRAAEYSRLSRAE